MDSDFDSFQALVTTFFQQISSKNPCTDKPKCTLVDGCVDPDIIADKFSSFKDTFTCNNPYRAETLKNEFATHYPNYCGLPVKDEHRLDTELVCKIIGKLEHGEAQDIDGLCTENLYYCHPVISIILAKIFSADYINFVYSDWI